MGVVTMYECPWCGVRRGAADSKFWDDHRAAHPAELEALRLACIAFMHDQRAEVESRG